MFKFDIIEPGYIVTEANIGVELHLKEDSTRIILYDNDSSKIFDKQDSSKEEFKKQLGDAIYKYIDSLIERSFMEA